MMRKYSILLLLVLLPQFGFATIIHIPADSATIQSGINSSTVGDTVLVDPGIYPENIDFSGKNICLASQFIFSGDSMDIYLTIIDGQLAGPVVTFNSGEDNTAIITGFTISSGQSESGGGIICSESNPTISNNIIRDNMAELRGAGIYCDLANPIIRDNMIKSNNSRQGGGIALVNSNPDIFDNTFLANIAEWGGGLYLHNSSPEISFSFFILNYVQEEGGAIYCGGIESLPIIQDCNFIGNSTAISSDEKAFPENLQFNTFKYDEKEPRGEGGAIMLNSGLEVHISNCLFQENNSYVGGAIFDISFPLIIENCDFISNYAQFACGAGFYEHTQLTMTDCNFVNNSALYSGALEIALCTSVNIQGSIFNGNTASNYGGGLSFFQADAQITNCTFNANGSLSGSAVSINSSNTIFENSIFSFGRNSRAIYCRDDAAANDVQFFCCDIYGNPEGNWDDCIADQAGINGNFELDPLFCDPANGNLNILPSSPCAPANNDCGVLIGAGDAVECEPLPLRAVICIDRSGSMFHVNALGQSRLERAKIQAHSDIDQLLDINDTLYYGTFEIAVMYFNADGIILLQDFTENSTDLHNAVDAIPGPKHDTPLAAAMCQAHCLLESSDMGQKLVFTYTDGLENQSQNFDMCTLCEPCNQYSPSGWNYDCGPDNPGSCTDWQLCLYQKFAFSGVNIIHYYGEPVNPYDKAAGAEGLEDLYFLKATAETSTGDFYYHSDIETVCGDANYDGIENIADAIWIINYVFSNGAPPTLFESADVNCDSSVNVSDAVYLINHIFIGGNSPCDVDGDNLPDCGL